MDIKIINSYYNDENTYIVYENGIGFVIDPGNSDDEIIKMCDELGVKIDKILLTHCHYDHIEFLEELREKTGAEVVCGKNCSENIGNISINLSMQGLGKDLRAKKAEIVLDDNEVINIGGMEIKCIYTPGHTNCCVCYIVENNIFVGDTLFLRNCGRWDLPTGDEKTLIKSVKERLYTLDENMKVYPGHGRSTSIGYEKKFNFIIK